MIRIICIGNRLVPEDSAGPMVFDRLRGRDLPPGVEVVDGGLLGLDLLRLAEGAERVVFVDGATATGSADPVSALDPQALADAAQGGLDHAAGLPYLLRVLPWACDSPPEVRVVGVAGTLDEQTIARAAGLALTLATEPGAAQ